MDDVFSQLGVEQDSFENKKTLPSIWESFLIFMAAPLGIEPR